MKVKYTDQDGRSQIIPASGDPRQGFSGNSANTRIVGGTGEQNRNRFLELKSTGAILSAHWPAGADISAITCLATTEKGVAATTGEEYVLVAVDSVDSATAAAELTETSSATDDVQWHKILLKDLTDIPQSEFLSNGPLGGGIIYAKAVGGINIDLAIGAS